MKSVLVIIPYFQNEAGILARCLASVADQQPRDGWSYDVVVVDDGSPVSGAAEVERLGATPSISIRVHEQPNGGPHVARNTGLSQAGSYDLVAFLDSDDEWPRDHLARAISAFEQGFDFYFTDNSRGQHHDSYVYSIRAPRLAALVGESGQRTGMFEIHASVMAGLVIGEFPCQISSVVFSRAAAGHVRFNTVLRDAGEDLLYLVEVALACSRCGLDLESRISCGAGVNIYYGNLHWDSARFLLIRLDAFLTHKLIGDLDMAEPNHRINREVMDKSRLQLAFHVVRVAASQPKHVGRVIAKLGRHAPVELLRLPYDIVRAVVLRLVWSGPAVLHERGF